MKTKNNTIDKSEPKIKEIETEINNPLELRQKYKKRKDRNYHHFFVKINGCISKKILKNIKKRKTKYNKIFYNEENLFNIFTNIESIQISNKEDILNLNKEFNHFSLLYKEKQEKLSNLLINYLTTHENLSDDIKKQILSAFITLSDKFLDSINELDVKNIPPRIIWKEYTRFDINKEKSKYETPESYFYIFEILHQIGFDIIILNPYGISTAENFIKIHTIKLKEKRTFQSNYRNNVISQFIILLLLFSFLIGYGYVLLI